MTKSLLSTLVGLCIATASFAQQGIISIVAGNGFSSISGDNIPATAASIGVNTVGVASDNVGNIYFSTGAIRKVSATTGIISTVNASVSGQGIAVDANSNIYVTGNYMVKKIDAAGSVSTMVGTGTIGYSGDGGLATVATIGSALDIAVDGSGNIYFPDYDHNVIRKVNASGIISTIAGNGVGGYSGDGGAATAAQLKRPSGIALDASGNLYIADDSNYVVRKISTSGIITTFAGNNTPGFSGDGGVAITAGIGIPSHLAMAATGDLYITDLVNWRVRKVDQSGHIYTIAGNGTNSCAGSGGLAVNSGITPLGIAVDNDQNILLVNQGCAVIDKILRTPDVIADSFSVYFGDLCSGMSVYAISRSTASLSMKMTYGDNSAGTSTALLPSSYGFQTVAFDHNYSAPGSYTTKFVLNRNGVAVDSATHTFHVSMCSTLPIRFYSDANSNCSMDAGEFYNYLPVTIRVDSNGHPVDSFSATAGIDYTAYGQVGDVYSFHVISVPSGLTISCPSNGILIDTIHASGYEPIIKTFGISCTTGNNFDIAEYLTTRAGRHRYEGDIVANGIFCLGMPTVVTVQLDPKYPFDASQPLPTTIVGSTVTWNIPPQINQTQTHIHFSCERPGSNANWLTPGDTASTEYTLSPISGDTNPVNNHMIIIDTVKSSFDPNEMTVSPSTHIFSGTELKYTIEFENTGNDTAHNIYIMDTLSDLVIPSTMKILASSATMNLIPLKADGHNIMKFDFPNIYLPDSSHHNQCTGMVMFTIKTKSGLPDGTLINNEAGIYFDDNEVVMTNSVQNIIGFPAGIATTGKASGVQLYPNPATEVLTVKMEEGAYTLITITNSMGQTLLEQAINNAETKVNVKTLAPGLYHITLRGDSGIKVQKFVKQ